MAKYGNIVIRLSLLVVISACVGCSDEDEWRIGVAAPFSGQQGVEVYGENILNAIEIAVDEVNAAGGVRGKRLRVLEEDTQLLPEVAQAAVRKLHSIGRCDVIVGPVGSSSTKAVARFAESDSVLIISPASTSHELNYISSFVFRTIAPDDFEGNAMAEFVYQRGLRRVGVVFVDNAGTRGPAIVFRSRFLELGGEVVVFEEVPQGTTEFRTEMTKLLSSGAEGAYLLGYALELGNLVKQAREKSSRMPLFSFQVMEEPTVLKIAGRAADGVIFTSPSVDLERAAGVAAGFRDTYRRRFNKDPGIFSSNAYDAIMLMAQVAGDRGFRIEDLRAGLSEVVDYHGASGVFDMMPNGGTNQLPSLWEIKEGQPQRIRNE